MATKMKTKHIDPNQLMLAHFNKDELDLLDTIVGGPPLMEIIGFDGKPTTIRNYQDLIVQFAKPKVRELFEAGMEAFKHDPAKGEMELFTDIENQDFVEDNAGDDPGIEMLSEAGTMGDDEIALVPAAVLDYFDALLGRPDTNPHTGLPMYGWLKKLAKPLLGLVGKGNFVQNPAKTIKKIVENPGRAIRRTHNKTAKSIGEFAKKPIGQIIIQAALAVATGGMSLPAQIAAHAATQAALSRARGNKWKDAAKDGAIAGITHGASRYIASTPGWQAAAKGGTHYLASNALGRPASLSESMMVGMGDYLTHGLPAGAGIGDAASGVYNNASNLVSNVGSGISNVGSNISSGLQSTVGGISDTIGSLFGTGGAEAGASSAGTGGWGETLGNLFSSGAKAAGESSAGGGGFMGLGISPLTAAGIAGSGYMMMKGNKKEKQAKQAAQRDADRRTVEGLNYVYDQGEQLGAMHAPLAEQLHPMPLGYGVGDRYGTLEPIVSNPYRPSPWDVMSGFEHEWQVTPSRLHQIEQNRARFARGGAVGPVPGKPGQLDLIRGPGKGQDDLIKYDGLHHGDYVMDAHLVSDLGDGATEAGAFELRKFVHKAGKKAPHSVTVMTKKTMVPTLLSAGEVTIPSRIVAAIGKGNNDRGAEILDRARELLRLEKTSKKSGLPPKAKAFDYYVRKAGGVV